MDCTLEEKLTAAIMPNDHVKHIPTGEEWVVCGVNYEQGKLVPCGYPFPTLADITDCVLIEKRYLMGGQSIEYIKALRKEGLYSFIDATSAMVHESI